MTIAELHYIGPVPVISLYEYDERGEHPFLGEILDNSLRENLQKSRSEEYHIHKYALQYYP